MTNDLALTFIILLRPNRNLLIRNDESAIANLEVGYAISINIH